MPEGYLTIFCCGAGVVIGFVLAAWGIFSVFARQDNDNAPTLKKHKRAMARHVEPAADDGRSTPTEDAVPEPDNSEIAEADAPGEANTPDEPDMQDNRDWGDGTDLPGLSGGEPEWTDGQMNSETLDDPPMNDPSSESRIEETAKKKHRRKKHRNKQKSAASRLNEYDQRESWMSFTMDFGDDEFPDMESGLQRQGTAYTATAHKAVQAMKESRQEGQGD